MTSGWLRRLVAPLGESHKRWVLRQWNDKHGNRIDEWLFRHGEEWGRAIIVVAHPQQVSNCFLRWSVRQRKRELLAAATV